MIAWKFLHCGRGYIKLLQYSDQEQKIFFLRQSLSKAIPLSNTKRNDMIVVFKFSILSDKSFRLEIMWVWEIIRIVHYAYQTWKNSWTFWNDVISDWNIFWCVMWNWIMGKGGNSQRLQHKSICVVQVILIRKCRTSVFSNNLLNGNKTSGLYKM